MIDHTLLKKIRSEKGITQAEMAEKLGYSDPSGYTKIEAGNVDIPVSKVLGIKNILKLTDKQTREIFFKGGKRGNNEFNTSRT